MKKKILYFAAIILITNSIVVYVGYSAIFPFKYTTAPVNQSWTIHLTKTVQGISLVQNNMILAVMASSVEAINVETGKSIWIFHLSSSSLPYPAFVKNNTAFLITENSLVALNTQDGKLLWQQSCECLYSKILDVSDEYILVNSQSYRLYAYGAETGAQLWFLPVGRGFVDAHIDGDLIYKIDDELEAVGAKTGKLLWSHPLDIKGNTSFSDGKLFYEGGNLYLSDDTYVVAFDVNKRVEIWRKNLNTQYAINFFVNGKSLYVSDPSHIFSFSIDNGNMAWVADFSESTNVMMAKNKLYALGDFSRTISEFDISSGKRKNDIQVDLPQLLRTEMKDMIVAENFLLFSKGKSIYAYTFVH